MSLVACPGCSRHIRISETSCPFCGASVADAMANALPRAIPAAGMSRAAMMAFAASLGAAACSSEMVVPVYGAPFPLNDGAVDGANAGGAGGAKQNTGGQMA